MMWLSSITIATTTTIANASTCAKPCWFGSISLRIAPWIISGTRIARWENRAAAVAYAENALANSNRNAEIKRGARIGQATRVQYWTVLPPRLSAASRHSLRIESTAGRKMIIISGIWK